MLLLTISVLYYAPQIFGALGLSSNTTSLLATGVVGIAMLLGKIPSEGLCYETLTQMI